MEIDGFIIYPQLLTLPVPHTKHFNLPDYTETW